MMESRNLFIQDPVLAATVGPVRYVCDLELEAPTMVEARVLPVVADRTALVAWRADVILQYGLGGALYEETWPLRRVGTVIHRPGTHFRLSIRVSAEASQAPAGPLRVWGALAPVTAVPPATAGRSTSVNIAPTSTEAFDVPDFASEFLYTVNTSAHVLRQQDAAGNNLASFSPVAHTAYRVGIVDDCGQVTVENTSGGTPRASLAWVIR